MQVTIKLFAAAKDLARADQITIDLAPNSTIEALRAALTKQHPALTQIAAHSLWAIGAEYASDQTTINEKSELALIPPVSGG